MQAAAAVANAAAAALHLDRSCSAVPSQPFASSGCLNLATVAAVAAVPCCAADTCCLAQAVVLVNDTVQQHLRTARHTGGNGKSVTTPDYRHVSTAPVFASAKTSPHGWATTCQQCKHPCPTQSYSLLTHLRCLGLGFKACVCEGEAAVVAEQADEGAKCHGLHPVVDLGHLKARHGTHTGRKSALPGRIARLAGQHDLSIQPAAASAIGNQQAKQGSMYTGNSRTAHNQQGNEKPSACVMAASAVRLWAKPLQQIPCSQLGTRSLRGPSCWRTPQWSSAAAPAGWPLKTPLGAGIWSAGRQYTQQVRGTGMRQASRHVHQGLEG